MTTTTTPTSIPSSTVTPSQMPTTTASPEPIAHYTTSSNLSAAILNRQETSVDIPKLNENRSVCVISQNESEFSNLPERMLSSYLDRDNGCFNSSSDDDSIEMQRGIILFQVMVLGRGQTQGVIDLGDDDPFDSSLRKPPRFNPPPIEEKNLTRSRSNSTEKSSHIAIELPSSSSTSATSAIPNEISEEAKLDGEEDLANPVSNSTEKSSHIAIELPSSSSTSATSVIPNEIPEDAKLEEEEDLLNSVRRFFQKMADSIKF